MTTLLDGYFLLEQAWVTALNPALMREGLSAASLDTAAALPLPITAYLIRPGDSPHPAGHGGRRIARPDRRQSGGHARRYRHRPRRDHASRLQPPAPDHIGGALDGDAARFPNASVHVNDAELAFWTDPANAASVPDAIRPWFDLAGKVVAAYGDRVQPFQSDADLGGGLSAVVLPGHTPGHSGYRVSSGTAQALLWGDSTVVASLQFVHPDAGIVFDTDSAEAAVTRRRVLDMAVADRMLVSGTHMPFPGFGHVATRGEAYAWVPEEWKPF